MSSADRERMAGLLAAFFESQRTYTSLAFGEASPGAPRPPATAEQIAGLERRFGRALPSSVATFLALHDGVERFHADGALLGTEDQALPWVAKRITGLRRNWQDVEPDPFEHGALPFMMGSDLQHFVVIAGDRTTPAGEPLLVEYDRSAAVRTFPDVDALLERELDTLEGMIERRRQG